MRIQTKETVGEARSYYLGHASSSRSVPRLKMKIASIRHYHHLHIPQSHGGPGGPAIPLIAQSHLNLIASTLQLHIPPPLAAADVSAVVVGMEADAVEQGSRASFAAADTLTGHSSA